MQDGDTLDLTVPANGIINMLLTLENGNLINEVDEAIVNIVELVKRRGGTGKINLTIGVAEMKKNPGVYNVGYTFNVVEPKRERAQSIMFSDRSNGLVTYKPEQKTLGFDKVDEEGDDKVTPISKAEKTE